MTTNTQSTFDNDSRGEAVISISEGLTTLLADVFAFYLKTKNFHWHMSGPHFRDYHLLLDSHAEQLFGITDEIAERVRKIGGCTIRSIGQIARTQRFADNDADCVAPLDMLRELLDDEKALAKACLLCTTCAMTHETLPRQAFSKTGSTNHKTGAGFSSKPHDLSEVG